MVEEYRFGGDGNRFVVQVNRAVPGWNRAHVSMHGPPPAEGWVKAAVAGLALDGCVNEEIQESTDRVAVDASGLDICESILTATALFPHADSYRVTVDDQSYLSLCGLAGVMAQHIAVEGKLAGECLAAVITKAAGHARRRLDLGRVQLVNKSRILADEVREAVDAGYSYPHEIILPACLSRAFRKQVPESPRVMGHAKWRYARQRKGSRWNPY
jgi:hypothetical protein